MCFKLTMIPAKMIISSCEEDCRKCPICIEGFKEDDEICGHTDGGDNHPIHKGCLEKYIIFKQEDSQDPTICCICKQSIDYTSNSNISSLVKKTRTLPSFITVLTASVVLIGTLLSLGMISDKVAPEVKTTTVATAMLVGIGYAIPSVCSRLIQQFHDAGGFYRDGED